jgi:hypothetical protein
LVPLKAPGVISSTPALTPWPGAAPNKANPAERPWLSGIQTGDERTTCFAPGPTRAQLTEALDRAEAKIARLYARGADTTSALNENRATLGELTTLSVEVVRDCDAENARLRAALVRLHDAASAYFLHNGAEHETKDCPEDDTCECPLVNAVNEAFAATLPLVEDSVR